MELHTCNNLSSMKKVVFGHLHPDLHLKRHFLCSIMGVRVYFYRAEYHDYAPILSCPSTQSADMEKAETSV